MHSHEAIARSYFAYWKSKFTDDDHAWAEEQVDWLVDNDPEDAWTVSLVLIAAAPSKKALAYVAAGTLETLLRNHGPALKQRFSEEAETNKRLRFALACVWLSEEDAVYADYIRLEEKYKFEEIDPIDESPWANEDQDWGLALPDNV